MDGPERVRGLFGGRPGPRFLGVSWAESVKRARARM